MTEITKEFLEGKMREMDQIEPTRFEPGAMVQASRNSLSTQVGGSHYKNMKIQPVEYALANSLPYCEGAVIKYVSRWRSKGGLEDLRKAKHFLELLMDHEINKVPES